VRITLDDGSQGTEVSWLEYMHLLHNRLAPPDLNFSEIDLNQVVAEEIASEDEQKGRVA
jgi:hypothetical protein